MDTGADLIHHHELPIWLQDNYTLWKIYPVDCDCADLSKIDLKEYPSDHRKTITDCQIKKQAEKRKSDYTSFFDSFA